MAGCAYVKKFFSKPVLMKSTLHPPRVKVTNFSFNLVCIILCTAKNAEWSAPRSNFSFSGIHLQTTRKTKNDNNWKQTMLTREGEVSDAFLTRI